MIIILVSRNVQEFKKSMLALFFELWPRTLGRSTICLKFKREKLHVSAWSLVKTSKLQVLNLKGKLRVFLLSLITRSISLIMATKVYILFANCSETNSKPLGHKNSSFWNPNLNRTTLKIAKSILDSSSSQIQSWPRRRNTFFDRFGSGTKEPSSWTHFFKDFDLESLSSCSWAMLYR